MFFLKCNCCQRIVSATFMTFHDFNVKHCDFLLDEDEHKNPDHTHGYEITNENGSVKWYDSQEVAVIFSFSNDQETIKEKFLKI